VAGVGRQPRVRDESVAITQLSCRLTLRASITAMARKVDACLYSMLDKYEQFFIEDVHMDHVLRP
jgi:hypothetical protein